MRVLDITDHLTLVMSYGVSLRVPYMKSLRGSLRVVLSCLIVLLLFYHKHTLKRSRFMHQIRVTL